jgi:tripartite-type tricarboxylate transporter receptor subunit TctC
MNRLNRTILGAGLCTAALAFTAVARADDVYPNRTIHVLVPWKAGGGTDAIGRAYAQALHEVSGQDVVVDNVNGASGTTGTVKVAHAKPDGYTILLNGNTEMTAGLAFRREPFSLDDFEYVGGVFDSPTWMVANHKRGYKSFADFAKAAKAHPGDVTVGVGGATGAHMLMAAAIRGMSGLDFRLIPYSGGADVKKALLGNQVDAIVVHSPILLNEVKAGAVDVLATGQPLSNLMYAPARDTPTLKSLGIPASVGVTRVVLVPKGTSKAVVDKLAQLSKKAVAQASYQAFGKKFGFEPQWTPGPKVEADTRSQLEAFQAIRVKYIH